MKSSHICCLSIVTMFLRIGTGADIEQDALQSVLSASDATCLAYVGQELSVDTLYSTFPQCQTRCNYEAPCASLTKTNECKRSSSFMDSTYQTGSTTKEYPYCENGYVCCFPELCRPRVLKCSFASSSIVEILQTNLDIQSLSTYSSLSNALDVEQMYEQLSPMSTLDDECTLQCNNWKTNFGDITVNECPATCRCHVVHQAQFQASKTYCCKEERIVNGIAVHRFIQPLSSVQYENQDKELCSKYSSCADPSVCVDYQRYQDSSSDVGFNSDTEKSANAADKSDSKAIATIVLISVGGAAAIALIVILLVLHRNKRKAAEDQAHPSGGHYTAI